MSLCRVSIGCSELKPNMTDQAEAFISNVRDALQRRGTNSIFALGRAFRIADDDASHALNLDEFSKGLRDFGVHATDTV